MIIRITNLINILIFYTLYLNVNYWLKINKLWIQIKYNININDILCTLVAYRLQKNFYFKG